MRSKKLWIGVAVVVLLGIFTIASMKSRKKLPEVETDKVSRGDVREVVNASGTLQAKKSVDVSAMIMGRITKLAVDEGDPVQEGDFLLEIDPKEYQSYAAAAQAALSSAVEEHVLAKANLEKAEIELKRSQRLHEQGLQTQEQLQTAETAFKVQQASVAAAAGRIEQMRANLDRTKYDLTKVTIKAPMAGTVTRLNVEEGETAIIGTMNNPGTLLMTIDDLSQMEVEVKVDETEIVKVKLGQPVDITIDAYPDTTFPGTVTEVGNSPIFSQTGIGQQAVDFKVVVTLEQVPDRVRPGLSASADIEVAKREKALTIPIAALVSREWPPPEGGARARRAGKGGDKPDKDPDDDAKSDRRAEQKAAEKNKKEGVFLLGERGVVQFKPVQVGIAGDERFEVISGVQEGDVIVAGPFRELRQMEHEDKVKPAAKDQAGAKGGRRGKRAAEKAEDGEEGKAADDSAKAGDGKVAS